MAECERPGATARLAALLLLLAAVALGGCAQMSYYGQSLSGHLSLVRAAKPVDEWLARKDLDPEVRSQLVLSKSLRDYASVELKLPDNDSYRRYADLQRGAAVWNVVATPELSLQLKTWCYLVLGCAGYHGYFDPDDARDMAQALRKDGLEVYVYGVPAYSTGAGIASSETIPSCPDESSPFRSGLM